MLRWPLCLTLASLCIGCGDSEDSESGSSDVGTSTTAATSASTSDGTSSAGTSTSTSSDSASSEATSAGTTASTTAGTSSTGDPGSTGGGGSTGGDDTGSLACEPAPNDIECVACIKPPCCNQWAACQNDDACACIIDCHLIGGGSLGQCRSQCGDSQNYNAIYFCGQMYCLGTCDWDSP